MENKEELSNIYVGVRQLFEGDNLVLISKQFSTEDLLINSYKYLQELKEHKKEITETISLLKKYLSVTENYIKNTDIFFQNLKKDILKKEKNVT